MKRASQLRENMQEVGVVDKPDVDISTGNGASAGPHRTLFPFGAPAFRAARVVPKESAVSVVEAVLAVDVTSPSYRLVKGMKQAFEGALQAA